MGEAKSGIMEAIERMAKISGVDLSKIEVRDFSKEDKEKEFKEIEPYILKLIGDEFKNIHRFEDIELNISKTAALKEFMLTDTKKFLILRGGTGTAKTCIAKILLSGYLKRLLKKDNVKFFQQIKDFAYYTRASDFFDKMKECFKNNDSPEWILKNLTEYNFLIIDEVGATKGSDYEIRNFTQLIDDYYRFSGKKMVLITNQREDEDLKPFIGERAFSRLCQHGVFMNFDGIDFRIQHRIEVA